MKQTAVEWLFDNLNLCFEKFDNGEYSYTEFVNASNEIKEQAKEMEKEQHGMTWDKSMDNLDVRGGNIVRAWDDFDEYYKETFKSEQQPHEIFGKIHALPPQNNMKDEKGNPITYWGGKKDDVEKLAEEVYLEHENNDLLYGESLELIHAYKAGIVDGYNKAKVTLYTEEDLCKAFYAVNNDTWIDYEEWFKQFKK